MTDEQIIIDGVNVKDCKRRIGKYNFCRYYKRPCAENNYNCIWKKYLRKEQECEELKETVAKIKEICNSVENIENINSLYDAKLSGMYLQANKILQKISKCEIDCKYCDMKNKEGKEMTAKVLINVIILCVIINLVMVVKIHNRIEQINKGYMAQEAVTVPSGLPANLEVVY